MAQWSINKLYHKENATLNRPPLGKGGGGVGWMWIQDLGIKNKFQFQFPTKNQLKLFPTDLIIVNSQV